MSSLPPSSDKPSFNDWLRVQRALMDAELSLANCAEEYANGEATLEQLNDTEQRVKGLRLLNDEVFRKVRDSIKPQQG